MHNTINLKEDIIYVGADDRRLALFENAYPIPHGVSYNSYLVTDEKTVLFDTVDKLVAGKFLANVEEALGGRTLDYLVISHMEPDHCAAVKEVLARFPGCVPVINACTRKIFEAYFGEEILKGALEVKEGEKLRTGRRVFTFIMAPMVHWPEVMMTYDETDGFLFSADAFGTFGALSGCLTLSCAQFDARLPEYRRYYANIVGRFGPKVRAVLDKAAALPINALLPLHGPVLTSCASRIVEKYYKWSGYEAEDDAVAVIYASVYGHTERVAEAVAARLYSRGIEAVVYDVSAAHQSYLIAEAFRCRALALASCTINGEVFPAMAALMTELKARNLQNRTFGLIESGSWSPSAGSDMRALLGTFKNIRISAKSLTFTGAPAFGDEEIESFADALTDGFTTPPYRGETDKKALYKLTYGLFVLSARGDKDNGCVVNTVVQLTSDPVRISAAVNKANFTHDLIKKSGIFNVSVLDESAPMELYRRFGMSDGRKTDKFSCLTFGRAANGVAFLTEHVSAYLSASVVEERDLGSHTLFIAEVTAAEVLGSRPPATYSYYQNNVKPKPEEKKGRRGFRCKVCGYEYIGDTLPPDFVCPVCKHSAEDFEPFGF